MDGIAPLVMTGIVFGVTYCAVPGSVNTESLRRGITEGFRPAFLIQTGSLLGDLLWAVLGLTGAALLLRIDALAIALTLVGAAFLFGLARDAFRRATAPDPTAGDVSRGGRPLLIGLMFSLANPAGLAFWTGMGGGLLATIDAPGPAQIMVLLTGFMVGAVLWCLSMPAAVAFGRRWVNPRLFRWVDALCGAALTVFGVRLLWNGVRRSLPLVRPLM